MKNVSSIHTGKSPDSAVYDAKSGEVYVLDYGSRNVTVINGTRVVSSIQLSDIPTNAVFNPANGYVYVATWNTTNNGSSGGRCPGAKTWVNVTVISGSVVAATIPISYAPNSECQNIAGGLFGESALLDYDQANSFVYVVSAINNSVTIISGTGFYGRAPLEGYPVSINSSALTGYVYVGTESAVGKRGVDLGNVTVLSGSSMLTSLALGRNLPVEILSNAQNGYVYVETFNSTSSLSVAWTNVSVITGTSLVGSFHVGVAGVNFLLYALISSLNTCSSTCTPVVQLAALGSMALDEASGRVYVPTTSCVAENLAVPQPTGCYQNVSVMQRAYVVASSTIGYTGPSSSGYLVSDTGASIQGWSHEAYVVSLVTRNVTITGNPKSPWESWWNVSSLLNGTVLTTVPLGSGLFPHGEIPLLNLLSSTYNSKDGNMYAVMSNLPGLTLMNVSMGYAVTNSSFVGQHALGNLSYDAIYDSQNGYIDIVDGDSSNVTVIPSQPHFTSPLSVNAMASRLTGTLPVRVNFTALPSGGTGVYTTWAWHFGDGGTSGLQNPSYTYNSPGTYTAWVNVTDSNGTKAQSNLLTITATPLTLAASAHASPTFGNAPLNVTFNATVSGGTPPYKYMWNGSGNAGQGVWSNNSTVFYAYTMAKTYYPTLFVEDAVGAQAWVGVFATIHVNSSGSGPAISTFSASPATIAIGGTTYLNVSASGGTGPLGYTYTGLPGGCMTANVTSLSCTPTVVGSFAIRVFVNDSAGHSANQATPLTVNSTSVLTISAFGAFPNPVVVNTQTHFLVNASDVGTLTYLSYAYTGLPTGCVTADSPALNCTPSIAGSFAVKVFVNDTNGNHAKSSMTLTVTSANGPTVSSFTASPPSFPIGVTTYLNVTVTGGKPPYLYAYSGLPAGCASANTPSLACTPAATGNATVTVTATDGNSLTTSKSVTFTVAAAGSLYVKSFTVSQSSIPLGDAVHFNVTASGGVSPYTYTYSKLPTGCVSSSTASLACTPSAAGIYAGTSVTVTDSKGATATSNPASLTVTAFAITLTSVTVSPAAPTVAPGGSQHFTANPACNASCPSGITYTWSLTNSTLGSIAGTGPSVTFTAGSTTGSVTLFVNATLNGKTVQGSPVVVTIKAGSLTSRSGLFGLSGNLGYVLVGVILAAAIAIVAALFLFKKKLQPCEPAKKGEKDSNSSPKIQKSSSEELPESLGEEAKSKG